MTARDGSWSARHDAGAALAVRTGIGLAATLSTAADGIVQAPP
jgi:hypothetical protein